MQNDGAARNAVGFRRSYDAPTRSRFVSASASAYRRRLPDGENYERCALADVGVFGERVSETVAAVRVDLAIAAENAR